jgi:hypothetical protein
MNGFEVYKIYLALKLHFSKDNYNFFVFNGKSRTSLASFEKRNDKYFFKKLALKYDTNTIIEFFVSHFIHDDKFWIGNISLQNSKIYSEWKNKIQSLSFKFSNEIEELINIEPNFDKIFETDGGHPLLLKQYFSGQLSLESLVILNKVLNFVSVFDKQIKDPVVWPDLKRKVMKYEPFLSIDTPKYKKILYETVCSSLITT